MSAHPSSKHVYESEDLCRLVENSPDILARFDRDFRHLYVSPAVTRETGLPAAHFIGKSNRELGMPDEVTRPFEQALERVFSEGTEQTSEFSFPRDGKRHWYSARIVPEPDESGEVRTVMVVSRNISESKLAAEALRQSEERYRTLFRQSRDVLFFTRVDGTILDVSPACETIYGYTEQEMKLRRATDFYADPADRSRFLEELQRHGHVDEFRCRHLRKDGTFFDSEVTATVRRSHTGEILGIQGIIRDISKWKETEREICGHRDELAKRVTELKCLYSISRILHVSSPLLDESLQEIVEIVPTGMSWPELAFCRLTIKGRTFRSCSDTEPNEGLSIPIRIHDRALGMLEVGYREPGGDTTSIPAEEKKLLEAIAERIAESVHRNRIQTALKKSEAYYRTVIENTRDLISMVDEQGDVLYASPSLENILGYKPEELIGTSVFNRSHPEDREEVVKALAQVVDNPKKTPRIHYRARHKDGTYRHLEVTGTNLLGNPAVGAVVINARDITTRRQLELQLAQSQKMEAIGRLAGGIAHDLNNLLTVVGVNAELLMLDLPEEHPSRSEAVQIQKASDSAAQLIRQLLAYGRRQVLKPIVMDLNQVLLNLENMVQRLIGEHILLAMRFDSEEIYIKADPSQIEHVILNLAINARDALAGGGKLEISTSRVEKSRASWKNQLEWPADSCVELSVSDNGSGMTQEVKDRIFEPFFTTKEGGSGLGLSSAYGIIKQSKGEILVESEPKKGTRFIVLFPSEERPEGSASAAQK